MGLRCFPKVFDITVAKSKGRICQQIRVRKYGCRDVIYVVIEKERWKYLSLRDADAHM